MSLSNLSQPTAYVGLSKSNSTRSGPLNSTHGQAAHLPPPIFGTGPPVSVTIGAAQ